MTWEHHTSYGQIALLCGDYKSAEKNFRKALLDTRTLQSNKCFEARTKTLLAESLYQQCEFEAASVLVTESEKQFQSILTGDAYTRAFNNLVLGNSALRSNNLALARSHFMLAAPLFWTMFSSTHPYYQAARTYLQKAEGHEDVMEWENKGELRQKLVAASMNLRETSQPGRQAAYAAWLVLVDKANCLLQDPGKTIMAYHCASEALSHAVRIFPHGHKCLADTWTIVGKLLAALEQPDAGDFLLAAANLSAQIYGPHAEESARGFLYLAQHHTAERRYSEAAETYKQAFDILRKHPASTFKKYWAELDQFAVVAGFLNCLEKARAELAEAQMDIIRQNFDEAQQHVDIAEAILRIEFAKEHPAFLELRQIEILLHKSTGNVTKMSEAKAEHLILERRLQAECRRRFLVERDLTPLAVMSNEDAA